MDYSRESVVAAIRVKLERAREMILQLQPVSFDRERFHRRC